MKNDSLDSDNEEYLKIEENEEIFDDDNNMSPKRHTLKDVKTLPEKLFIAIDCLLDDTNDKVRLAAAITIFTVERNKKAPKAKEKVHENTNQLSKM